MKYPPCKANLLDPLFSPLPAFMSCFAIYGKYSVHIHLFIYHQKSAMHTLQFQYQCHFQSILDKIPLLTSLLFLVEHIFCILDIKQFKCQSETATFVHVSMISSENRYLRNWQNFQCHDRKKMKRPTFKIELFLWKVKALCKSSLKVSRRLRRTEVSEKATLPFHETWIFDKIYC